MRLMCAGSVVGVGLWLAIAFATSAKMGTPMWEGIDPSSVSLPDQEVGLLLKQGGESLMSSLTSSPLYTAIFVAASPAGRRFGWWIARNSRVRLVLLGKRQL